MYRSHSPTNLKSILKSNRHEMVFFFFIVVFFISKLIGIKYGLAHHFIDMDEEYIVPNVLKMLKAGSLDTGFYFYGSTFYYMLYFVFSAYFLLVHASKVPFAQISKVNIEEFYYVARLFNSILAIIILLLIYYLGKKYFNKDIGLAASFLLGFSYIFNLVSITARVDMVMLLFLLASFIFIARIIEIGSLKDYLFAGLFVGLATATKYYSLLMIFSVICAHYIVNKKDRKPNYYLYISVVLIILLFCVINPYHIIHWNDFMQALSKHILQAKSHHWSTTISTSKNMYMNLLRNSAFGTIGFILFIISVFLYLLRPKKKTTLLILFPFLYFILSISSQKVYPRYLLTILPFLALFLMNFVYVSVKETLPKFNAKIGGKTTIFWVVSILIIVFPAFKTIRIIASSTLPLTSDLAVEWINKNIPQGSHIWCQKYTAIPDKSYYSLKELRWELKKVPKRAFIAPGNGCHYAIFRKNVKAQLGRGVFPLLTLIKTFRNQDNKISGPDIDIYEISSNPSRRLMKKNRKPFSAESFPVIIDIGNKKNDYEYICADWSKPHTNTKRESFRILTRSPAKFYFRLAEDDYGDYIEIKLKLSANKADSMEGPIILKVQLNDSHPIFQEYNDNSKVYIFKYSTKDLIFRKHGINSFSIGAQYNTESGYLTNEKGFLKFPTIRVFNIELRKIDI